MERRVGSHWFNKFRWAAVAAVALGLLVVALLVVRDGDLSFPIAPSVPTLEVSDQTVHARDVIELDVHGPSNYTWGLPTSLERSRDSKWKAVYAWATWPGGPPYPTDSGPLEAISVKAPGTFWESIGFIGDASFMIEIPDVEPGDYRITITFIKDGPGHFEERTTIPAVQLTVVP